MEIKGISASLRLMKYYGMCISTMKFYNNINNLKDIFNEKSSKAVWLLPSSVYGFNDCFPEVLTV